MTRPAGGVPFTSEQEAALAHPGGLLLTATAGSGKTSVMAERYVRAARAEEGDVARILAITFTEKAAGELKARVRARFEALGDDERARATEGAWISTIHSLCARLLRAHALVASLDPRFAVLDEREARRLSDDAFRAALDDLVAAHGDAALELIAAYRAAELGEALVALHGELRSRGQEEPRLPPARPADPAPRRSALALARAQAAVELAGARDGKTIARARERLAACEALLREPLDPPPAPRAVEALALPRNGATALAGPGCVAYRAALEDYASACSDAASMPVHALLDALLQAFARRYGEAKRAASALDFEDLELRANRLLRDHEGIRARYAERFQHVLVDEFQDTNPLQLELLERIAGGRLFAVGDELQSIYGFRHADVQQFRARRAALAEIGAATTLATNFRSHPDLLDAFNLAFAPRFGASFTPLVSGRDKADADRAGGAGEDDSATPLAESPRPVTGPARHGARVELLVVDRSADWEEAGLVAPGTVAPAPLWRLAEARLLAARVRTLLDDGYVPGDVVLLLRATGDLAVYERALVERGVPTYVIGGRGYWSQQQVRDLVSYLAVLANPRNGVALFTLLASPLVGLTSDALVQLSAAARASGRDTWWTLTEEDALPDRFAADDRERLLALRDWLPQERRATPRHGLEALLDRVLARTGYDLVLLRMEGGARRLANVRKLMRLAREHEARHGRDLRGFADLVTSLVGGADASGDERESEAPVEGEALDAVRVMTIHRAKGLEFPVVCVADLGRESPSAGRALVRVGRDGRVGIRLKRLDGAPARPALAYAALVEQQQRAEADEEARLFYVAATRARERLILSGAVRCDPWPDLRPGGAPLAWLAPAFVPDVARRCAPGAEPSGVAEHDGVSIAYEIARPTTLVELPGSGPALLRAGPVGSGRAHTGLSAGARASSPPPARSASAADAAPPIVALSYTSLQQHARCGYRFYLERVLRLPPTDDPGHAAAVARRPAAELDPRVRGSIVHAVLEEADLSRAVPADVRAINAVAELAGVALTPAAADEIASLLARFHASTLRTRIAAATDVRPEHPFSLRLTTSDDVAIPLVGVIDVLAREDARTLVVDYKSDRLAPDASPAELVEQDYALQRMVYALAALHGGAAEVEVVHCFLERPDELASASYAAHDVPALEADLVARADAVLARDFRVAPDPGPRICDGCPGRGSLCSWPIERTRGVPEGRLV
ncbi:MAG TPA: UvrD-helicase domain-containing protein [Conexibacter sp.]|nr:UvrD-helicase domain-containing protein [Conexibacter sp.]